jgi:hypothetical protein
MSTALASARRRRAGPEAVAPAPGVRQTNPQPSFPGSPQPQSQSQSQPNMGPGLTLPQVIALVDKRLNILENFMHTQKETPNRTDESENDFSTIIEEYNSRFDIIADEIGTLKDTVMKLQTYTMEVNKMLMEDRIRILSDAPTPLEQALSEVNNI